MDDANSLPILPSYGEALANLGQDVVHISMFHDRKEDTKRVNKLRHGGESSEIVDKISENQKMYLSEMNENQVHSEHKTYGELYQQHQSHVKTLKALSVQNQNKERNIQEFQKAKAIDVNVKVIHDHQKRIQATSGQLTNPSIFDLCQQNQTNDAEQSADNGFNQGVEKAINRAYISGKLILVNQNLSIERISRIIANSLFVQMRNIKVLLLPGNQLTHVPEKIYLYLSALEVLDVSQNHIWNLPSDIHKLQSLKTLNIQYNRIESFEPNIYEYLKNLETFLCAGNTIGIVDAQCALSKSIKSWDLANNKLVALPDTFSSMKSLEKLNLSNNNIETLALIKSPGENDIQIEKINMADWKQITDPVTGDVAYQNVKTKECRRTIEKETKDTHNDLFDVDALRQLFMESKEDAILHKLESVRGSRSEAPDQWIEYTDDSTGLPYYYCEATGETSWERPASMKKAVPSLNLSSVTLPSRQASVIADRKAFILKNKSPEWIYWINSENGATEYGNLVTGKIVRKGIPREVDNFGKLELLKILKVNKNKLTSFPESCSGLVNLERLEISHNALTSLPDTITQLTKLKLLQVSENKITALPENIGKLVGLESLSASGNKLTDVPDSIEFCQQLKRLELNGNLIVDLNDNVGKLQGIEHIFLMDNPNMKNPREDIVIAGAAKIVWDCRERQERRLRGLPPPATIRPNVGIASERLVTEGQFQKNLTRAIEDARSTKKLTLNFLGLRSIPEKALLMTSLVELRITGNADINELPSNLSLLKNLEILIVSGNGIATIPDSDDVWNAFSVLVEIDLSKNKLTTVPASIRNLKSLKSLTLNANAITELAEDCFYGPISESLETLRMENNKIAVLPSSICLLKKLTGLYLSWNQLRYLPEHIGQLQKLTKLYLNCNQLQQIPESMGTLAQLKVLQVAGNELTELPLAFYLGEVRKSLEQFYLQRNRFPELPFAFGNLRALQYFSFELNPTHSPPPSFRGKPWTAEQILDYCDERYRRYELMCEGLSRMKNFEFVKENLYPVVSGALVDRFEYLSPERLAATHLRVDNFLNSNFYDHEEPADSLLTWVNTVFENAKNDKFVRVLHGFLELLHRAEKYKLLPKHCFERETHMSLGFNNESVLCFAVKMDAVFNRVYPLAYTSVMIAKYEETMQRNGTFRTEGTEEDPKGSVPKSSSVASDLDTERTADTIESGAREDEVCPSLIESCRNLENDAYDFTYCRDILEIALEEYRGPFGHVCWYGAPFQFEGEVIKLRYKSPFEIKMVDVDEQESSVLPPIAPKAKRGIFGRKKTKKKKRVKKQVYTFPNVGDGRSVVIMVKTMFTFREAEMIIEEKVALEEALAKSEAALQAWIECAVGVQEIKRRAIDRMSHAHEFVNEIRHQMQVLSDDIKEAALDCKSVHARISAFEHGSPFPLHRFNNAEEATAEIDRAEQVLEEREAKYSLLKTKLVQAKARSRMKLKEMIRNTRERLLEVREEKIRSNVIERNRQTALDEGLRRPWDGVGGEDFEAWKVKKWEEEKRAAAEQAAREEEEKRLNKGIIKLKKQETPDPLHFLAKLPVAAVPDENVDMARQYDSEFELIDEAIFSAR